MKTINYIIINFFEPLVTYMLETYTIFKVVPVVGRADDLMWIQVLHLGTIIILLTTVFLLLLVYVLSNILNKYQYYILAKFNRPTLINLVIKLFINKFTSIYLPILILIGVVLAICVSHSLITHPLPFWEVGIDLTQIFFSK